MPYTPPGQTPTSSAPPTPSALKSHSSFRSPSYSAPPRPPGPIPRSSSYLNRHRRTPSFQLPAKSEASRASYDDANEPNAISKNVHQAPPPSQNRRSMPAGAVLSPPDSSQNSSDEEVSLQKRRGRVLENLEELQKAIRGIEQRRESSPTATRIPADLLNALEHARQAERSLISEINMRNNGPLTAPVRRAVEHSKADTALLLEFAKRLESTEVSDGDDGLDTPSTPARMVRKKSGELVKPALRVSSRRRPLSMPGTPTYGKAVHFDSHLEQVKHFSHVDKPLAVSAGTSPVESHDSDTEFPWGTSQQQRIRQSGFEWDIETPNFPKDTPERLSLPVRVEKIFVSGDNRSLTGYVAVQNLAYHKQVAVRFTMDYWKTTSEVLAEFDHECRGKMTGDGTDRFSFNIQFADQAHVENKVMFFCVRYNTNGQEFWDNNNHVNFQVEFRKRKKKQARNAPAPISSTAATTLSQLPRSRGHSSPRGRPKSMLVSFDDFAHGFDKLGDTFSGGTTADLIGESCTVIKLKDPKKALGPAVVADASQMNQPAPVQAFANRYNFGASLTAAILTAKDTLGEKSGFDELQGSPRLQESRGTAVQSAAAPAVPTKASATSTTKPKTVSQPSKTSPTFVLSSEKSKQESSAALMQSSSYNDLINKYCFFGTAKASSPITLLPQPSALGTSPPGQGTGTRLKKDLDQRLQTGNDRSSSVTPPSAMERAAFNFIPLSEPRREQHVVEPSAVESSYQHYEPYQANQGGFSFSGTQTPTAIVI